MREPILREISKKAYYRALRKLGYQDDDFTPVELFCGKASWFVDHYTKEPVYHKEYSMYNMLTGHNIIGYKYYKIVGWRNFFVLTQQFIDAMKEHGITLI